MSSFLISASITGRAWRRLVRCLVFTVNILVWCARFDVLSVTRWAPKRSTKDLTDYRKTITGAEKTLKKAQAVIGAHQLRLSECRCKRDSARDTIEVAVKSGAHETAGRYLQTAATYEDEIAWLEQQETVFELNITKLEQTLEQARNAVVNPTPSGGVMQASFISLNDSVEVLKLLATDTYKPSLERIEDYAKQLDALVNRKAEWRAVCSVCSDCGGTGKMKGSEWPCTTCYDRDFRTDIKKRRIEALGWTVSREDDRWLAKRGLREVGHRDIEVLAGMVVGIFPGPETGFDESGTAKTAESHKIGRSSILVYDDHPMYGHVLKYWPSWVELHCSRTKPHMAELDSDQSGRKGHRCLVFTMAPECTRDDFESLWGELCGQFKAHAAVAVNRAAVRNLPSELLRAGWSCDYTAETADGRSVCSDDPDAVAWSLSGAVNQALGAFSDPWQRYFKELGSLLASRMTTELRGDALVYMWNRRVATGQDAVVALAEEVERRLGLSCGKCSTIAKPRNCDVCGTKFCPGCERMGNGSKCNQCWGKTRPYRQPDAEARNRFASSTYEQV